MRLTIHSSRNRFAVRLNSGVRLQIMPMDPLQMLFLCWSVLTGVLFVAALLSWRAFTALSLAALVGLCTFVGVSLHRYSQSNGTPGEIFIPVVVLALFADLLVSVTAAGLSAKVMRRSEKKGEGSSRGC